MYVSDGEGSAIFVLAQKAAPPKPHKSRYPLKTARRRNNKGLLLNLNVFRDQRLLFVGQINNEIMLKKRPHLPRVMGRKQSTNGNTGRK